jgi:hypothetical protein
VREEGGERGGDGWKIKWKLSEVNNTRAVSRGQNELIGKFKMAVGDMISISGQAMEYTYIPTGIKMVVCEIWCGLQPEGVSWRRTSGHSFYWTDCFSSHPHMFIYWNTGEKGFNIK